MSNSVKDITERATGGQGFNAVTCSLQLKRPVLRDTCLFIELEVTMKGQSRDISLQRTTLILVWLLCWHRLSICVAFCHLKVNTIITSSCLSESRLEEVKKLERGSEQKNAVWQGVLVRPNEKHSNAFNSSQYDCQTVIVLRPKVILA